MRAFIIISCIRCFIVIAMLSSCKDQRKIQKRVTAEATEQSREVKQFEVFAVPMGILTPYSYNVEIVTGVYSRKIVIRDAYDDELLQKWKAATKGDFYEAYDGSVDLRIVVLYDGNTYGFTEYSSLGQVNGINVRYNAQVSEWYLNYLLPLVDGRPKNHKSDQ